MRPTLEIIEDAQSDCRVAMSRLSCLGKAVRDLRARSVSADVPAIIDIESIYRIADEIRHIETILSGLHERKRGNLNA